MLLINSRFVITYYVQYSNNRVIYNMCGTSLVVGDARGASFRINVISINGKLLAYITKRGIYYALPVRYKLNKDTSIGGCGALLSDSIWCNVPYTFNLVRLTSDRWYPNNETILFLCISYK